MTFKMRNSFAADVLVGDVILLPNYNSRGDVYARVESVSVDKDGTHTIKMMYLVSTIDIETDCIIHKQRRTSIAMSQFHRITKF